MEKIANAKNTYCRLSEETEKYYASSILYLVDAVVGEMHEDIPHTAAVVAVLVRGKAHQAVVVEVDAERVHTGHQHVQTQVKLGSVDQVGTGNVSKGINWNKAKEIVM